MQYTVRNTGERNIFHKVRLGGSECPETFRKHGLLVRHRNMLLLLQIAEY
jgi:hypothetical protein